MSLIAAFNRRAWNFGDLRRATVQQRWGAELPGACLGRFAARGTFETTID